MGIFVLVNSIVNQVIPTTNSNFTACVANCVSTATQANYVCGTDGNTYINERTVQCSNVCKGGTSKFFSYHIFLKFLSVIISKNFGLVVL